jgi:hypothetical protein
MAFRPIGWMSLDAPGLVGSSSLLRLLLITLISRFGLAHLALAWFVLTSWRLASTSKTENSKTQKHKKITRFCFFIYLVLWAGT